MADKIRRGEQAIDELRPLIGVFRVDIDAGLGDCGDAAGQVERQAADQGGVVGLRRGRDVSRGQFHADVMIDDIGDRAVRRQEIRGRGGGRQGEQGDRGRGCVS